MDAGSTRKPVLKDMLAAFHLRCYWILLIIDEVKIIPFYE